MQSGAPIDEASFRQAMASFATGVTVVTTAFESGLYGVTVNAFCSVSLNPPLVLVSIDELARSRRLIAQSGIFAVNVLSWQQQFLADRFAARAPLVDAAFTGVPHVFGVTGAPLLEGAVARVDCRVSESFPAGDHALFLGAVLAVDYTRDAEPLLVFRSRYERLRPR